METAPLLFISSNPSVGEDEDYPTQSWPDEQVVDYFTNRFGGGRKQWTKDGNRGLRVDGTYGRWSPFWSSIRARAAELFEREVLPGRDFALTEVVRCKSLGEEGVRDAADECFGRYMRSTLEHSVARVIVTLGKVAEEYVRRLVPFTGIMSSPTMLCGRERIVAVLPHPNARKVRSFAQCFAPESLNQLRRALQRDEHASHAAVDRH